MSEKSELMQTEAFDRLIVERNPLSMVVTNPNLDDNPIVYVNRAFEKLTGYSSEVCVGRNCRFLQGEDTRPETIEALSSAIAQEREVEVEVINYRSDGKRFVNRLLISPIYDDDGKLAYFLGIQRRRDKSEPARGGEGGDALREIQHRVKNHLQMVVSMIRMQAQRSGNDAKGDFSTLANRVETLQLLYEEMTDSGVATVRATHISLGAYLTRIISAVSSLSGRPGVRVNVQAESFHTSVTFAAQLGLMLSEVFTNALQHAFSDRDGGLVEVQIRQLSQGLIRLRVADDGAGMPADSRWPETNSLGARIIKTLIEGVDGRLSVDSGAISGTTVTVDIPFQGETNDDAN